MVSVYPFSDQNGAKPLPDWGGGGGGGTYLYGLYKGVPPGQKTFSNALHLFKKTANSVTYISPLRIRTHVEELCIEGKFGLTNRRASVSKLWLQIFLRFPIVFIDESAQSMLWLIYWHLKNSIVMPGVCWVWTCFAIACSKRSDSGEPCEVKKAMKSRGGLGRTRTPFYFAPLPTIWTPGTG